MSDRLEQIRRNVEGGYPHAGERVGPDMEWLLAEVDRLERERNEAAEALQEWLASEDRETTRLREERNDTRAEVDWLRKIITEHREATQMRDIDGRLWSRIGDDDE